MSKPAATRIQHLLNKWRQFTVGMAKYHRVHANFAFQQNEKNYYLQVDIY